MDTNKTKNGHRVIEVNERYLSDGATREQAEAVVFALRVVGWPVMYRLPARPWGFESADERASFMRDFDAAAGGQ